LRRGLFWALYYQCRVIVAIDRGEPIPVCHEIGDKIAGKQISVLKLVPELVTIFFCYISKK